MKLRKPISHLLIKELIHYDPETGKVTSLKPHLCWLTSNIGEYSTIIIEGERYLLHRVIWFYITGKEPGYLIDHRDKDPRNNRWNNLRELTFTGNALNTFATGVSWHKNRKYWITHIRYRGKKLYLGHFYDKDEALEVVANKRAELLTKEVIELQ